MPAAKLVVAAFSGHPFRTAACDGHPTAPGSAQVEAVAVVEVVPRCGWRSFGA